MLLAVWFDTPRRKTLGRLTTNGVGATGAGARRTAWVGWVIGICGSTRAAGYGAPAHHERGRAGGAGARRTTWVGWVLGAVWFDTPRRKTLGRLTTNGGRPRGELNRELSRRLGCCWLCGSTRAAGYGAPAHHERGRAGGAGARRTTWVGWVLGAVWFDTPRRKTLGRLTTNGGRPRGELNRELSRRLGCCWLCGSTRAAGYGAPAHHERLLPLDWVRMSGLVDCGLRFGGLGVGGGTSRGR